MKLQVSFKQGHLALFTNVLCDQDFTQEFLTRKSKRHFMSQNATDINDRSLVYKCKTRNQ